MTREELINFGELFLEVNNDSKNSNTYKFIDAALKLFKQEPVLEKVKAEIIAESFPEDDENSLGTLFPDNLTNGDMIEAMFPNLRIEDNGGSIYLHYPNGGWIVFDRDWWNAPYMKGE